MFVATLGERFIVCYCYHNRFRRPQFPQILTIWQHRAIFSHVFTVHVQKRLYLCVSGENVNTVTSCCVAYSTAVIICGKKAIHEALVVKSVDFADRPDFFQQVSKGFMSQFLH